MLRVPCDGALREPPGAVRSFRKLVVVDGGGEEAGRRLLARRQAIEEQIARTSRFARLSFEDEVVRPVPGLEARSEAGSETRELFAAGEGTVCRNENAVIRERLGPSGAVAGIDCVVVPRVELLDCQLIFDA